MRGSRRGPEGSAPHHDSAHPGAKLCRDGRTYLLPWREGGARSRSEGEDEGIRPLSFILKNRNPSPSHALRRGPLPLPLGEVFLGQIRNFSAYGPSPGSRWQSSGQRTIIHPKSPRSCAIGSGSRPSPIGVKLGRAAPVPHPEAPAQRASKDAQTAPCVRPSRLAAARRAPQDEEQGWGVSLV